jgi:hypothetical protein
MMVAPASAKSPISSGNRLEFKWSAYQPEMGLATNIAAPYTAKSTETQYCTSDSGTPARDDMANGITGTTTPYRKMSVNTAIQTVARMKRLDDRSLRRRGGVDALTRRPWIKFPKFPPIAWDRGYEYVQRESGFWAIPRCMYSMATKYLRN